MSEFESLPVELIAEILGELDLESLITVSYLSRRLHSIASDSSLNPWRRPILRNLLQHPDVPYESCLTHLSVRSTVPRQNWIEIMSLGRAEWLLLEATPPHLKEAEWEECFKRRFIPGWQKWKKDEATWRSTFRSVLYRVLHRSNTSCTSDESWTRQVLYVLIRRGGVANELEASSRNYDPIAIFDELKMQSNLDHLETRIRLVVELADVRVIAFGVLNKPRGATTVNTTARMLLHPPGIERDNADGSSSGAIAPEATSAKDEHKTARMLFGTCEHRPQHEFLQIYRQMTYPLPALSHANYPFYTPSGEDKRWIGTTDLEEEGMQWVGGLMLTAQLIGPRTKDHFTEGPPFQDWDLVQGSNRAHYASFTLADLAAIAPWLDIPKQISGPGLGND
ncbi:uncharacterized protein PHACADRAFT_86162 [Phanerochaete carnosa HHB-10118-sp]|uniref:F-box domain-containing protein n=1 Tax=Phanerochaete carnosa (strain HHB-10118-sp) TaxID=650164 RepID=K5X8X9_PHACS|nr:uncharacterized protein PHACADRAFT_86162 [Phanerochaete carnosa HHB-10118-sp]EKM59302.1 hypothetical protein PHACADRAFT_86162 [Phanerochaete carnosa HHB-10118-sp]